MGKNKKLRYKGISKDRRFIIFEKPKPEITEDLDKRTKLWISSDYLFEESLLKDPTSTKEFISLLLDWNIDQEKYENCKKLSVLLKKCETFVSSKDI